MSKLSVSLFLLLVLASLQTVAQDTIVFENRFPMIVEIIEESESRIIYKKYPPEKGDLAYTLKKRFVTETNYVSEEDARNKFKSEANQLDKKLDVWVNRIGRADITNGLMHGLNDSSLILKKKSILFSGPGKGNPEIVFIFPYQQIDYIKVRKQNQIVQYAFAGAAIGFTVGILTGLTIFDDSPACDPILPDGCDPSLSSPRSQWDKALTLGFTSAGAGALTGGIVGGLKIKIPIGGRKDHFNALIPKLNRLERALRKE